jgi:hypothetical protein
MAETDLIARKILASDPSMGYGESAVVQSRQRGVDTNLLNLLERAKDRKAQEEDELKKSNDYFHANKLGKLHEVSRFFADTAKLKQQDLFLKVKDGVGKNRNLNIDPNVNETLTDYNTFGDNTMRIQTEVDNVAKTDFGPYIERNLVDGATTRNALQIARDYKNGDASAITRTVIPNVNSFEFFKTDKFIYDIAKDIKMSEQSTDKKDYGGLGEYITTTSNGYRFATKDANGNLIPGVDKSIIKYFLESNSTDPNMLQFRDAMGHAADLEIENKALKILKNDPRYKGIKEDEVQGELRKLKDQIAYDQNSNLYEGRDAIQARILKDKLEPFQQSKEKTDINAGFKYPTKDGDGEDEVSSPEGLFIKTLAGLEQQTPEFISDLEESNVTNNNNVPYLDATHLFKGINTGQDKDGKVHEPYKVLIDTENPGTIYVQQRSNSELSPVSDAAISQFAVSVGNIKGNNLNYKKIIEEGGKMKVFGKNNQFIGENAATADKESLQAQKELAEKVSEESVNRLSVLNTALNTDKKSWITDFNRGTVDKIQDDINKNVLKGTTLIDSEGGVYKNPTVEIERGLLGGVTYVITGSDNTKTKLTEDEFKAITKGTSGRLVVGRKTVANTEKKSATKAKAPSKPKTITQNGHTYTWNEAKKTYE